MVGWLVVFFFFSFFLSYDLNEINKIWILKSFFLFLFTIFIFRKLHSIEQEADAPGIYQFAASIIVTKDIPSPIPNSSLASQGTA